MIHSWCFIFILVKNMHFKITVRVQQEQKPYLTIFFPWPLLYTLKETLRTLTHTHVLGCRCVETLIAYPCRSNSAIILNLQLECSKETFVACFSRPTLECAEQTWIDSGHIQDHYQITRYCCVKVLLLLSKKVHLTVNFNILTVACTEL